MPNATNPQELNRYAYGNNNPVKFTDPTGNKSFLKKLFKILAIIVAVVAIVVAIAAIAVALPTLISAGGALFTVTTTSSVVLADGVTATLASTGFGLNLAAAGQFLGSAVSILSSAATIESSNNLIKQTLNPTSQQTISIHFADGQNKFDNIDINNTNNSGSTENSSKRNSKGLGNPFKNKTPDEVDKMFKRKGFEERGESPETGEGGYVNPETERSYHVDLGKTYKKGQEYPHVDVNRPRGSRLPKKKYPLGEKLYGPKQK